MSLHQSRSKKVLDSGERCPMCREEKLWEITAVENGHVALGAGKTGSTQIIVYKGTVVVCANKRCLRAVVRTNGNADIEVGNFRADGLLSRNHRDGRDTCLDPRAYHYVPPPGIPH